MIIIRISKEDDGYKSMTENLIVFINVAVHLPMLLVVLLASKLSVY